jgi:hypothetical protein
MINQEKFDYIGAQTLELPLSANFVIVDIVIVNRQKWMSVVATNGDNINLYILAY